MTERRYPNLFILGAPKCGTTAMSSYLAGHPDIFMSEQGGIKEPKYFCSDRWYSHQQHPKTENEYLALFDDAPSDVKYLGEATPRYLQSTMAVPAILENCERPRFVVMLRNPVDLVVSQYNQRVKTGQEDQALETAWHLQRTRLDGKRLPLSVDDGRFVEYGYHAQLGRQMQLLLDQVDPKSLHCIFFEDFKNNPGESYRQLLAFLGLPDDGRQDFASHNTSMQVRSPRLAVTVKRLVHLRDRIGLPKGMGVSEVIKRFNRVPGRTTVRPEFRRELQAYFKDDIDLLSDLMSRDLSHWYTG